MRKQTSSAFLTAVLVVVGLPAGGSSAAATDFPWQQAHAKVLPHGDLVWAPTPYRFNAVGDVRYIDFAQGADSSDGRTRHTPWKHHPWDVDAADNARAARDLEKPLTYVFKGGVTYRGFLAIPDVGAPDGTRLARDPEWGEGPAVLAGSEAVTNWRQADPPHLPEASLGKVWAAEVDFLPRAVWMVQDGTVTRIALARSPNWTITDWTDIHANWATWDEVKRTPVKGTGMRPVGRDAEVLGRYSASELEGAVLWTEYTGAMGTAYADDFVVVEEDPVRVQFERWYPGASRWPQPNNRYYLEDSPAFLDAPGEFWFQRDGKRNRGRLFVRLPGDRNPNEMSVEAARHPRIIQGDQAGRLTIEGLTFRFTNLPWPIGVREFRDRDYAAAAIDFRGSAHHLMVRHCVFEHVNRAVRAQAWPDAAGRIERLTVSDCVIQNTDFGAIEARDSSRWGKKTPPYATIGHAAILRNRLERIGFRPPRQSHGHALNIRFPETSHIAGNIGTNLHAAGVFVFGGGPSGQFREAALSRHLIHHNRIERPLLGSNDWAGIETWQVGPFYVYNNVVIDPGGYYHAKYLEAEEQDRPGEHNRARWGFAYYADGSSKNYFFNNIALGGSNDPLSPRLNTAAMHDILAQQNMWFQNTVVSFATGYARSGGHVILNTAFISNLFQDLSLANFYFAWPGGATEMINADQFARNEDHMIFAEELALTRNVFGPSPAAFGNVPTIGAKLPDIEAYVDALKKLGVLEASTGVQADRKPLPLASSDDFRPDSGSPAVGQGSKVFVPWSLVWPVGEWHFRQRSDDPSMITDEAFALRYGMTSRTFYHRYPRHHLHGVNISADDFTAGVLEDWIPGALRLNGTDQYLVLRDEDLARPTDSAAFSEGKGRALDRSHWRTPDVGDSSFLIELFIKPIGTNPNAVLIRKSDGKTGYELGFSENGGVLLLLLKDGETLARVETPPLEPGRWRHVVAEIDRSMPDGLTLYIDGEPSGRLTGAVTQQNLDNNGDLFVGGSPQGGCFRGEIDFARICLGTLKDANTSIEALRAWQFDGPFLRDFAGNTSGGKRAAAGALEPQ